MNNRAFSNRAGAGSTPIYDITSSGGGGGGGQTKAFVSLADLWAGAGETNDYIARDTYKTLDVAAAINNLNNDNPPVHGYGGYARRFVHPGDSSFVHAATDIWIMHARTQFADNTGDQRITYLHDVNQMVPADTVDDGATLITSVNDAEQNAMMWQVPGHSLHARRRGGKLDLAYFQTSDWLLSAHQFYLEIRGAATSGGSGGGDSQVLFTDRECGSIISSNRGSYFTHDTTNPQIWDASGLTINQSVQIDLTIKINDVDFGNATTDNEFYENWVQLDSPIDGQSSSHRGNRQRATWLSSVTIQPGADTSVPYVSNYRMHLSSPSYDPSDSMNMVNINGSYANSHHSMFGEELYMYRDPRTWLVYRAGSDGKIYAFIETPTQTNLNIYGDGTSASGSPYYTMSAKLTHL